MRLELVIVPDCPHAEAAAELFRQALDDIGLVGSQFDTTVVSTTEDAVNRRFAGSPSFVVDGEDVFCAPSLGALACRVYTTDGGRAGLPALRNLRQALKQAANQQRLASTDVWPVWYTKMGADLGKRAD